MILLVKSGGEAALPEWQAAFAACAPRLDVRWWDDPDVPAEQVAYALVWAPEPGRLAALPNLRLILSSGAGVEHITQDPAWPRHLPIVRMGGKEVQQRMGEYVCLGALALLRDLKRIVAAQADRRWDNFDAPRTAADTRVGIMGLGNLGERAAEMLRGLGFQVSGWSRSRKQVPGVESFAGPAELPRLPGRRRHPGLPAAGHAGHKGRAVRRDSGEIAAGRPQERDLPTLKPLNKLHIVRAIRCARHTPLQQSRQPCSKGSSAAKAHLQLLPASCPDHLRHCLVILEPN